MTELEFVEDADGNLSLTNQVFEKCAFDSLHLRLRLGQSALIKNVKFINCKTTVGTCVLRSGFVLDKVTFSNFACGDAIRISAEAILREVVVEGRKPRSLLLQPQVSESFVMPSVDKAEYQLDISNYHGEVVVIGMRGDMVRKDPARQVTVKYEWMDQVDWEKLGIEKHSFWRIYLYKLRVANASEGVYSLPFKKDRWYEKTMEERKRLEDIGLCFD